MRAQVSILAITGVLIILVGVGVFVAMQITTPQPSSGFEDVELAFAECIEGEMRTLLPIAALHGGELAYSIETHQTVPRTVRDPQGLLVPVWVSFDDGADPLFYRRPKLHDRDTFGGGTSLTIEEQFERMLDDRLASCLDRSSRSLDVDTTIREVTSEVVIGDTIRVSALAVGSFDRDGRATTRLSAQSRIDSSFLSLFDIASEVSALEASSGVFAAYVEDIIVLGSGVDSRYPPMYEYDFSYATRFWTADAVAQDLSRDLDATLGLIQFSSANTPSDPPYLIRRGLLDLEYDDGRKVGDEVFISVSRAAPPQVSFDGGRVVSGQPLISMIPIVGELIPIREYRTHYDVKAPMIVTLTSRDDGLRMRFAIEPRIENNRIMRSGVGSFSGDSADVERARKAFCDEPSGASVSVSLSGSDPADTTLVYRCGAITCSYPYDASITIPACVGGSLSAQARDVRFETVSVDSQSSSASVSLSARQRVDASVTGRLIDTRPVKAGGRPDALETLGSRGVHDRERMIITFEGLDLDHSASAIIDDADAFSAFLYEGVYSVSVVVVRDLESPVIIPEREECEGWCMGGNPIIGTSYIVDQIDLIDTLLLAQYADLGPVFIGSGASVRIEVPIFDIERIAQSDRVAEDLEFYDVLLRSLSGDEVIVS